MIYGAQKLFLTSAFNLLDSSDLDSTEGREVRMFELFELKDRQTTEKSIKSFEKESDPTYGMPNFADDSTTYLRS
ncbi:hypothetical protein LH53_11655 [Mesotoga sp. TolDC]|nr:hypothetical protein LH53_11655 [Mesotoga sp. TolDC]